MKPDGHFDFELEELAAGLGEVLRSKRGRIVTAESCTGGWLSASLTAVPDSSQWFAVGFTAYSNQAKIQLLRVPAALLKKHGAVSEEVVQAMAAGALQLDPGALLAVSSSGIAGPGRAGNKNVGTVCIGWAVRGKEPNSELFCFGGSRNQVRRATVQAGLRGCIRRLI